MSAPTIESRVAEAMRRLLQSFSYEPQKWFVTGEGEFLVSKHNPPGQIFRVKTSAFGLGYLEDIRIAPETAKAWHALASERFREQEKIRVSEATAKVLARVEAVFSP